MYFVNRLVSISVDDVQRPRSKTYTIYTITLWKKHEQRGAGVLQPSPYVENWTNNSALKVVYDINKPLILQRHQETPLFNIPLANDFSSADLMEAIQDIYESQKHAYRLNLQFALILVNTETEEYRYFRPYTNESLFIRPIYISRRQDLVKLKKRLDRLDVMDYILKQRPNTKWKAVLVTNVHFSLFHLNYILGSPVELPDYIKTSRTIVWLNTPRSDGQPYDDNLCAFRCLATHSHGHQQLETNTQNYVRQWIEDRTADEVFSLDQMVYFEKCFAINVNVNVYDLKADGTAISVYKSRCQFADTMHLNMFDMFEHHLSYICNFNSYASKYQM